MLVETIRQAPTAISDNTFSPKENVWSCLGFLSASRSAIRRRRHQLDLIDICIRGKVTASDGEVSYFSLTF